MTLNPFHGTGLFLCPLKSSESLEYREKPVAWNGLKVCKQTADMLVP